jgi:hypothetical protein
MTPEDVAPYFTRMDGDYLCARWGRPIAPVLFGVEDATVVTFKGAIEALCVLAGHRMAETDPELGANLMVFFVRDWAELAAVPDLDRLIPGLRALLARLEAAEANQYRVFRFDEGGAIKACFAFLRLDEHIASVPAETLALSQMAQAMLLWSDAAFRDAAPVALIEGRAVLRPEVAEILRAAYDPVLPAMARDPSHALRLAARTGRVQ